MDDIIKLLAGFEETAYKILMLFIIIPKTLLKIIFDPVGARKYVEEQLDLIEKKKAPAENKPSQEPFLQYLSPVLLLLTLALVPALLLAFLPKTGVSITSSAIQEGSTQYEFRGEAAFSSSARGKGYEFKWEVQNLTDNSVVVVVHSDNDPGRNNINYVDNKATDTYTHDFVEKGDYRVKVSVVDPYGNVLFTDSKSVSVKPKDARLDDETQLKVDVTNPDGVSFQRQELNIESLSKALEKETTIFLAFALLLPPLFFAFVYSLATHKQINEKEMRKIFYVECYYFSPLSLAIWAFYYSLFFLTEGTLDLRGAAVHFVPPLLALIWFVSVETNALADESEDDNINRFYAFLIVVACVIIMAVAGLVISMYIADPTVQDTVRKIIIGIYLLISVSLIGIYFINWNKARKQVVAEKKTVAEDQKTPISPRLKWIGWSSLFIVLCCIAISAASVYGQYSSAPSVESATPSNGESRIVFNKSNSNDWQSKWQKDIYGGDQSKVKIEYENIDGIRITLTPEQEEYLSALYVYNAREYSNVQIEISAKVYKSTPTVSLICRYNDMGWYEFEIFESDGYYSIYQVNLVDNNPDYTVLTSGNSAAVQAGKENVYSAACSDNNLSLFINNNDTPVETVKDTAFAKGMVGVGVYSPESKEVAEEFKYVTISESRPQQNLANLGATATPTLTPIPETSVTEQFDAGLSNWDVYPDLEQVQVDPANKSKLDLQLIEKDGQYPAVDFVKQNTTYRNVQMGITIDSTTGTSYGVDLYCRISDNGWYSFEVLNDGSYSIAAYNSVEWTELASGSLPQSKIGQGSNTYKIECKDDELTLILNGERVKSLQDTQFKILEGSIGFGVFSLDGSPINVSVDSVTITEPASQPTIPDTDTATDEPGVDEPASQPSSTDTETATVEPGVDVPTTETPVPQAQQFFTEEFDRDPHWDYFLTSGDISKATVSFDNSIMTFDLEDLDIYAYYLYDQYSYDDVSISIRAENRGRNNNNVSLVCRKSDSGWYEFSTEGGGVWYLYRVTYDGNGDVVYDAFGDGGAASLNQGLAVNEYGMTCNGNEITLSINGKELRKIVDSTFTSGQVGFNISSLNVTPIIVDVDWFKISPP